MIEKMSHIRCGILLLAIAYFFLMFGNGIVSLTHPDEVFYSQVAKEMLTHKSWLTPILFDEPNFEKPIFFFWLLAGSFQLWGITPFVARLAPSLFGILGVLATYWMAFMLFRSKRAAFLSGLVLSTSFVYIALSRAVLTDMVFSVLVVVALCFFYYGFTHSNRRGVGIVFCFVFSGIAVLTKGILGVLFVFLPIILFLWHKEEKGFFAHKATFIGILLFCLITVPWHAYMFNTHGQAFYDEYVTNVHLRRIVDAEHQKSNTWYFYLITMFGGMFPWAFFLIPAVFFVFRTVSQGGEEQSAFGFILFWILFVLLGMQVAQSKLASYIFPVFPGLAIILGYYFHRVLEKDEKSYFQRSMRIFAFLISGILLCVSVAGLIFGKKYIDFVGDIRFPVIFSVLFFCCAVSVFVFTWKRLYRGVIATIAAVAVIVLSGLFAGNKYAEPWVSCKLVCDIFNKMKTSDGQVLSSKFYVRGVRFYTNRDVAVIAINDKGFFTPHPVPFLNDDRKVLDFLNKQKVTYCIVKESNVKDLERIAHGRYHITYYEEIGGKYILKIEQKS